MTFDYKLYKGVYKQEDGNTFVIDLRDSQLYLKVSENRETKLIPAERNHHFDCSDNDAKIEFYVNEKGAHSLCFTIDNRSSVAKREFYPLDERKRILGEFKGLIFGSASFIFLIAAIAIFGGTFFKGLCDKGIHVGCSLASTIYRVKGNKGLSMELANKAQEFRNASEKSGLESGCEAGNKRDCMELAAHYNKLRYFDKSQAIYTRYCDSGDGDSCLELARVHKERGDFESARATIQKACQNDMPGSCYEIATTLDDRVEKIKLFEKACNIDNKSGCWEVGEDALKVAGDHERALIYFKKACESNVTGSCRFSTALSNIKDRTSECRNGNGEACLIVSDSYNEIDDSKNARSFLIDGCRYKNQYSCSKLEQIKKIEASRARMMSR